MTHERHHLAEIIGDKTMHITDSKQLAQEIAAYLLLENKVDQLDSLMRDVMNYRAERGIVEANLVSAHTLSDADIDDVKAILREEYPDASSFTLDQRIDPAVVGGVKIELPGEQLDLTIRDQLNTFRRLTERSAA